MEPRTLAGPPPCILVVDDEPEILATLEATFRRTLPSASVWSVESGEKGLPFLEQQTFDVILSDYRMPRMDGLTFLEHAQRIQPGSSRVLMTGHPELNVAIRGLNGHVLARFLTKPFLPREVAGVVTELMAERDARRAQQQAFARSLDVLRRRVGGEAPPAGR